MGLQKLVRDSQLAAEEMGSEWPLADPRAALGPTTFPLINLCVQTTDF